ncbi:MAG: cytochrome c family protein [Planctomycetota bacterium]|nr:cytochrome c family protein [Planctomycetota bacterium]MDP6940795.1 cytochrome c family protein [Planctomycetota bacterium]
MVIRTKFALFLAVTALLSFSASFAPIEQEPVTPKEFDIPGASFIGAKKCKNCHKAKSQGAIYSIWESNPHAQAFDTLKGEEAAKVAKEHGIEKAWEAPECLRCHTTGYGFGKKRVKRTLKKEQGVGCESCHGPGSLHNKTRLKIANSMEEGEPEWLPELPRDETLLPDEAVCVSCHNEESPTYRKFEYGKRLKEIEHLHPNRKEPRVKPPKLDKDGNPIPEEKP